jgi:hypothetical protein
MLIALHQGANQEGFQLGASGLAALNDAAARLAHLRRIDSPKAQRNFAEPKRISVMNGRFAVESVLRHVAKKHARLGLPAKSDRDHCERCGAARDESDQRKDRWAKPVLEPLTARESDKRQHPKKGAGDEEEVQQLGNETCDASGVAKKSLYDRGVREVSAMSPSVANRLAEPKWLQALRRPQYGAREQRHAASPDQ